MKTKFISGLIILVFACSNAIPQNLLKNGDFEASIPNGTFPVGWQPSWHPTEAGSVTTSTAARTGKSGLWMFTTNGNSFSRPYQEVNCTPLKNYKTEAYLRSPKGQSWTKGTVAFVSISFKNASGVTIQSVNSDSLKTANTDWKLYSVNLTAPKGAVKVRFTVNLESQNGQSICNVDNCSLSE